jgi:CHASE1-domain containing sensor protein
MKANKDPLDPLSVQLNSVFSKYNIVVLIVVVLFIIIGVGVGVGVFFSLQSQDNLQAYEEFTQLATDLTSRLYNAVSNSVHSVYSVSALFACNNGTVDFYKEFVPFSSLAKLVVNGTAAVEFSPIVYQGQEAEFVAKVRSYGPDFVNFTLLDRAPNGSLVPSKSQAEYYPIVYCYPISSLAPLLGYNIISSSFEVAPINRAKNLGIDTATPAFTLIERVKGFIFYSPAFSTSTGQFLGLAQGLYYVDPLINTIKDDTFDLVVFDTDLNVTDPNYVVYSSLLQTNMTYQDELSAISKYSYSISLPVSVADRSWNLVYLPTSKFLSQYVGWQKWAALAGSLIAVLVIAFIISVFIKRIEHNSIVQMLNKERLTALEESKIKLSSYLERIAEQEEKTRATVDAIPEWVLVVDADGKITSVNLSFEKRFKITKKKLDDGLYLCTMLQELDKFFFTKGNVYHLKTNMVVFTRKIFPVTVTARPIMRNHTVVLSQNNHELPEVQSYVIVIKTIDEDMMHPEYLYQRTKIRGKTSSFDEHMKDENFKTQLWNHCEEQKTVENLEFLELVQNYKKMSVEERIEAQLVIFNTYIAHDSSRQLNLIGDIIEETRLKVENGLGDISTFDEVVLYVKDMLILDVLPRFRKSQRYDKIVFKYLKP